MTIIDQMKSPVQPDASSFILNLSSFFKNFKDTLHTMLHYMPSFQLIGFQESLYWSKYAVLLLSNEFIFHVLQILETNDAVFRHAGSRKIAKYII